MSYSSEVLADNPVAYWRLDENTGTTAADASPNSRPLTYSGGYTLAQAGLVGSGTSVLFNGSTGTAQRSDAAGLTATGVTLECWVHINTTTGNKGAFMKVGRISAASTWNGYALGVGSNTGNIASATTSNQTLSVGTRLYALYEGVRWLNSGYNFPSTGVYHVVLTIAANGTGTFFVNGTQVGSVSGTAPSAPTEGLAVGGYTSTAASPPQSYPRHFDGRVDEAAVYTSVLSSARITAHYNTGLAVLPANTGAPGNGIVSDWRPGSTLSVIGNGTWTGTSPITYANTWERSADGVTWTTIAGATSSSYVLSGDDVNFFVRGGVVAMNAAGSTTAYVYGTDRVLPLPSSGFFTLMRRRHGRRGRG